MYFLGRNQRSSKPRSQRPPLVGCPMCTGDNDHQKSANGSMASWNDRFSPWSWRCRETQGHHVGPCGVTFLMEEIQRSEISEAQTIRHERTTIAALVAHCSDNSFR